MQLSLSVKDFEVPQCQKKKMAFVHEAFDNARSKDG